jgi:hypothetical protein
VAAIVASINERQLNRPLEVLFVDESHFTNEPYVHRGWFRKGQQTRVPQPVKRHDGVDFEPLAPYSPEHHPIERFWQWLKAKVYGTSALTPSKP